jgi:2-polyprenyl-3-methyl-5-hydroxy-6-metoxy-1,4-benzoquinol methylase
MSANAKEIIAIEPDVITLEWAKSHRQKDNIKYLAKYSYELGEEYNSYFDLITAVEVIEHVEDYYTLIQDCLRLLKDDGTLVMTTPNRLCGPNKRLRPKYKYHVREFSAGEMYFIFDMFFEKVNLYALQNSKDKNSIRPVNVHTLFTNVIVVCQGVKRRVKEY